MESGTITLLVVIGGVLLVVLWLAAIYNTLVRLKNACDESWSDIDTELKRRYDLIPNLVETVKGYATHERETLENVVRARNVAAAPAANLKEKSEHEEQLTGALRQLFAVAEAYPDLKANTSFLQLQEELTITEDRVQRSRRFYNGNVRELNTRIEVFPSNIVANTFGFTKREFFELENPAMREAPKVKF